MNGRAGESLDASVRRAESLVGAARALALALIDLPGLELPPAQAGTIAPAQLRAIATLYLASELEGAGVTPAAEDLVRLARSGALRADLGEATSLLQEFWLARNDRATTEERQACFAALFGTPGTARPARTTANDGFEDDLLLLCEALYKLDEQASNPSWGGVAQQARVRSASERVLDGLAASAGGLTVFLAQEILDTIKQSLKILGDPAVVAAFGGRGVRDVVRGVSRLLRRPEANAFDLHVRRGQAGLTIMAWLAEALPLLASGAQPLVGIDHPVIPAAVDWLEASLALAEVSPAAQPQPREASGDAAGWDQLAS
jgi:hypothetical protein